VRAPVNNLYNFKSNSTIHLYGYLYNNSFTQQSSENLLTFDNDNDGDGEFYFSYYLEFQKEYILVVTTRYANTTGPFTIFVTSSFSPVYVSLSFPSE